VEELMSGASRFGIAVIVTMLAISPAAAGDVPTSMDPLPSSPPSLYEPTIFVHVGALGAFANPNASPTGGGLFTGASNIAIPPVYTLVLDLGYYFTPNIAIEFSTAVPPITHFKATGLVAAPIDGTDLLGSARYGELSFLLQYHCTQFGPLQPYLGAGVGYALNFGNISDGILRNFYWDQNFAFLLQAGTDYMFTPNWGVFANGTKVFFSTDSGGFAMGLGPVRAHVTVDPWVADVGITFKY
jgi:outer membrane protein